MPVILIERASAGRVVRVRVFIDPDGKLVSESAVLREWRPISRLANDHLYRYLVGNLGFVLCDYRDKNLNISLSSRAISEVTTIALLYVVADYSWKSNSVVSVTSDGRLHRVFRDADGVTQHLLNLAKTIPAGRHSRYDRRRIDLGGPDMVGISDLIEMCSGAVTAGLDLNLRRLLREDFKNCFLILKANRVAGHMTVLESGSGYPGFSEDWRRRVINRPLGDFDDKSYGQFVMAAYRQAATNAQPTIERIECTMRGAEPVHMTYDRVIVPLPNSNSGFLSATIYRSRTVLGR